MAIATLDQYVAATKQRIPMIRGIAGSLRTVVALIPFSTFDLPGQPGAGTLSGGSTTAAGVVPTDATAGCPKINFTSGTGYITKIEYGNTVISRINLYDMLWKAGAYGYGSATTNLSAQPAISGRCPDYPGSGTSFGNGNEIWIEVVAAMTNATSWTVYVTYTDQDGNSGTSVTSTAQAAAALTVGKMFQLALAAGDSGVQKINSVVVANTGATAGSFNVLILRPLCNDLRVRIAGEGGVYDMLSTGMPVIYSDSALIMTVQADAAVIGLPHLVVEIASA